MIEQLLVNNLQKRKYVTDLRFIWGHQKAILWVTTNYSQGDCLNVSFTFFWLSITLKPIYTNLKNKMQKDAFQTSDPKPELS